MQYTDGAGCMSKIMEELLRDRIREDNREIAIRLIEDRTLPLEKIAKYLDFTLKEVEQLAK